MNKLKLEVIRFNNEDVIATSCRSDIISFGTPNDVAGYKKSLEVEYNDSFEDIMDQLYGSDWDKAEDAITDQGKAFHVLANGTIEVCNDPLVHYNQYKDDPNWYCYLVD